MKEVINLLWDAFWSGLKTFLYTALMWAFFSTLLAGLVYEALLLTPHATAFATVLGYVWSTVAAVAVVRLAWQAPLFFIEKSRFGREALITPWPPNK